MKTILISFNILLVLCMFGCSKKKPEVEVTKDNFAKFDSFKFVKVFIVCFPKSNQWLYHYEFPINDSVKVEVIKRCIKDANHTEYDIGRFKKRHTGERIDSGLFVFETPKVKYTMQIGWDDKSAYGLWWESPELLSIFRGWGLFEDLAKADPNWPAPVWYKNPPPESDPNFPPNRLPSNRTPG